MKKCKDCNKEIDKYAIACEYCGKLTKEAQKPVEEKEEPTEKPENQ